MRVPTMKHPSLRTVTLVVESLIFTVVVPGTVTAVIPALILPDGVAVPWPVAVPQFVGLLLILAGTNVYFWCLWHFVATGRGIPAPLDHPRQLVVRGLHRYVRNPMYLGVLCVLVGEALLFRAAALVAYAIAWWLVVHAFVVVHEEPALRARFGREYDDYAVAVRRWIPGTAYRRECVGTTGAHVP